MILRTTATIVRAWGQSSMELPGITYYHIVIRFTHPETGREIKRTLESTNDRWRRYRRGDVIRIRINTAVPIFLRAWVLDE